MAAAAQDQVPAPDDRGSGAAVTVTFADVEAAADVLRDVVRTTPVEGSRTLSALVGGPVHLKCENLQRTGSFKIRGAYNRLAALDASERAVGVVAASAGNHAQGVALAASLLGIRSTIFMPVGAPLPKVEATRAYGADVRLEGHVLEETFEAAISHGRASGAVFVHPFDHPAVVAGQGTVGLEVVAQVPGVRTVLVPTGGGGLVAGVAVAVRGLAPGARVVGVQAAGAAAYPPSLAGGRPVGIERTSTMADGIAVARPGEVPFGVVREQVDRVVTVGEESLSQALLLCLERAKLVVEPAGAAGVAALMDEPGAFEPPVVVVLSGGNIDPLLLHRVLRHGLAAAGRFLTVRVRLTDRPGGLHALLGELAAVEVNVLEVEHVRTGASLGVDEVEVEVQVETRGPDQARELVERLRASGYRVEVG